MAVGESMTALTEFSLEKHPGPYESWPLNSRLLRNGEPTRLSLRGYQLLYQFHTQEGFLFVTDYDCPFEESTFITLCDSNLRQISRRFFGWPYTSFILHRVEWLDPRHLVAVFDEYCKYLVTIRPWGIPWLRPRLKLSRMKSPNRPPMTGDEKLKEMEETRQLSFRYVREGAVVFGVTAPVLLIAQKFITIRPSILWGIFGIFAFGLIGNAINYFHCTRQIRKMQHQSAA